MQIDVLIPCAEPRLAPDRLRDALAGGEAHSVRVLADESLSDDSRSALERAGVRVTREAKSRGARLRDGARGCRAEVLLFLHADTRLPRGWADEVRRRLAPERSWGAFRLGFEDEGGRRCLDWVAFGANLRSKLLALPFGDQAPFVRRKFYEQIGGHPPWPLLDDLELSRRMRRRAPPALSRESVRSSARRYHRLGALRTILLNSSILVRFACGQTPASLYESYRA